MQWQKNLFNILSDRLKGLGNKKSGYGMFFFLIGAIYYFSFQGITVGDAFYKSFEVDYPLFLSSNFMGKYHWFGFLFPHFLNYPTLRFIQIALAKIGLLPLPVMLFQITNLVLSLATLKLIYSILLRLDVGKFIAMATVILFGFSFAFYSNMNAEFHHFGVFFIAAYIWFLVGVEKRKTASAGAIFALCLCLALAPLYHIENIIYSSCVILYVLMKKDLRDKFKSRLYFAVFGLIICPLLLIVGAFTFHYLEFGSIGVMKYIQQVPDILWLKRFGSMANSAYSHFSLMNVYIMLRAFLESFSVVSRVAKIAQHYNDIVFYSDHFSVNLAIGTVFCYCLLFLTASLNLIAFFFRNFKKIFSPVRLLLIMFVIYTTCFGIFMNLLLSEFYITAAMIYCILLGFVFNKGSKLSKSIYISLALLTVFSNIYLYIYPQKISAASINRIFNDIKTKSSGAGDIDIFRASFIVYPEELERRKGFKIYYDEHAYESKESVSLYFDTINSEFIKGKRIFLIGFGFLFGDSKEVNFNSAIPMGMDEDPNLVKNLKYLVDNINSKYKLSVSKDYSYNFWTLGVLGKVAVVELK